MSTIPPSFLFAGLDQETLSLQEELHALGGGDTTTTPMKLFGFIEDIQDTNDAQVLWDYETTLGVRDVSIPRGEVNAAQHLKHFSFTGLQRSHFLAYNNTPLTRDIIDSTTAWLQDGFNACLLLTGSQRHRGKTRLAFGDLGKGQFEEAFKAASTSSSLMYGLLQGIFHQQQHSSSHDTTVTIGISAWALQKNHLIDLMLPSRKGGVQVEPLDFAVIECPEISTAMRLLHEARARLPGCLSKDYQATRGQEAKDEDELSKAHFFCRLVIHKQNKVNSPSNSSSSSPRLGTLSSLYLADLVGMTSIDSSSFKHASEDVKQSIRQRNHDLTTLYQVFREMANITEQAKLTQLEGHGKQAFYQMKHVVTSARHSKLTTLLAPILQGNMQTSVLTFLPDGESHAKESKQILHHMHHIPEIITACYRVKDIPLEWLNVRHYEESLPPTPSTTSSSSQRLRLNSGGSSQLGSSPSSMSDYGDINLESILQEDFSLSKRSAKSVSIMPTSSLKKKKQKDNTANNMSNLSMMSTNTSYLSQVPSNHSSHHLNTTNLTTPLKAHDITSSSSGLSSDGVSASSSVLNSMSLLSIAKATPRVFERSPVLPQLSTANISTTSTHQTHDVISPDTSAAGGSNSVDQIMNEFHHLMQVIESQQQQLDGKKTSPSSSVSSGRQHSQSQSKTKLSDTASSSMFNLSPEHSQHRSATSHVVDDDVDSSPPIKNTTSPLLVRSSASGNRGLGASSSRLSKYRDEEDHMMMSRSDNQRHGTHLLETEILPASSTSMLMQEEGNDEADMRMMMMGADADVTVDSLDHSLLYNSRSQQPHHSTGTYPMEEEDYQHEVEEEVNADEEMKFGVSAQDLYMDPPAPPHHYNYQNYGHEGGYDDMDDVQSVDSMDDASASVEEPPRGYTQHRYRAEAPHANKYPSISSNSSATSTSTTGSNNKAIMKRTLLLNHRPGSQQQDPPRPHALSSIPSETSNDFNHKKNVHWQPTQSSSSAEKVNASMASGRDSAIPDYKKYTSLPSTEALEEIEHLQRTKESLLQVIQEGKQQRQQLEDKIQQLQDDFVEQKATYEVEIDSYKYDLRQSQLQIKQLCNSYGFQEVYEYLEHDIQRLMKENDALRSANIQLEAKELHQLPSSSPSSTGANLSYSDSYHQKNLQRLLDRLKKSGQERELMKQAYEALKSKERQFLVQEKLSKDAARRLRVNYQDLQRTKVALEEEKKVHNICQQEKAALQEEISRIRLVESQWHDERSRVLSEVNTLRSRVYDLEMERQRHVHLAKFLDKHAPSSSPSSTNAAGRGGKLGAPTGASQIAQAIKQAQHDQHIDDLTKSKINMMNSALHSRSHTKEDARHMTVPGVVRSSHEAHPASYLRIEETDALNNEIELTLAALHDSIISTRPSLLPLVRKLTEEIHHERKLSLEQRATLLDKIIVNSNNNAEGRSNAASRRRSPSPTKRFK